MAEGLCLAAYHTGDAVSVDHLRGDTWFPRFAPQVEGAELLAPTDLQESTDRSRMTALHDALTGLSNRILLLERCGGELATHLPVLAAIGP